MKKPKKKIHIASVLIFFLYLFLIMLSITIFLYFFINKAEVFKSLTYGYNNTLNHEDCIKENEFLESKCYQEGRSYVADLLDKIKIKYVYEAATSLLVDYDYKYDLTAQVVINEYNSPDHVLYDKLETLNSINLSEENTNSFVKRDTIDIDFQKYNDLVKSFKKNYAIAVDANLYIKATTNIYGTSSEIGNHVNLKSDLLLTIPLGKQVVDIENTKVYDKKNDTAVVQYYPHNNPTTNTIYSVISKTCIVVFGLVVILLIKYLPNLNTYKRRIKKILKTYDRAIVIVKTLPKIDELVKVEVATFEELLDARDNFGKPIICYEDKENRETLFMCPSDKNLYLYIIGANDGDKKDEKNK